MINAIMKFMVLLIIMEINSEKDIIHHFAKIIKLTKFISIIIVVSL